MKPSTLLLTGGLALSAGCGEAIEPESPAPETSAPKTEPASETEVNTTAWAIEGQATDLAGAALLAVSPRGRVHQTALDEAGHFSLHVDGGESYALHLAQRGQLLGQIYFARDDRGATTHIISVPRHHDGSAVTEAPAEFNNGRLDLGILTLSGGLLMAERSPNAQLDTDHDKVANLSDLDADGDGLPDRLQTPTLIDAAAALGQQPLAILALDPGPGAQAVHPRAPVRIYLNGPVAAGSLIQSLSVVDEAGVAASGVITLLEDGQVIRFDPDQAWTAGAHYTVQIGADLLGKGGLTLDQPIASTFRVVPGFRPALEAEAPLQITGVSPLSGTTAVDQEGRITLTLNQPLDPEFDPLLPEAIELRNAHNHKVPLELVEVDVQGRHLVFQPLTPMVPGQRHFLSLDEGLVGANGVSLDEPIRLGFQTAAAGERVQQMHQQQTPEAETKPGDVHEAF